MSVRIKLSNFLCTNGIFQEWQPVSCVLRKQHTDSKENPEQEFRALDIFPKPRAEKASAGGLSRFEVQEVDVKDADWTNVWVGPKSFNPYMVPLPVRQGYRKKGLPPGKYANAELMKIPNFLHLTPPAVQKHCEALKKFCTKWPEELQTEEDMDKHFPVNVIASDYCNSLPTIRDPLARIVTVKVKLSDLKLDKRCKDKFLRLVGERYDPKTDIVTITTDSCPLKKQNYDYAMYILTALCFESRKVESWEGSKGPEDMEEYIFSKRKAIEKIAEYYAYNNREAPAPGALAEATEICLTNKETAESVEKLKAEVLKVVGLSEFT
ncbi:UNVERIFIED_CONTAM: hypothetical protein PYX00_001208 [Menopon gallinae]|uniref:Small ribosomal subunit protein mS35 mitochondrial conserved domain-containing protein n=1 Tax=Menopon gallinae TaxID=328185 RepID=A0AAW2IC02_9NEOP